MSSRLHPSSKPPRNEFLVFAMESEATQILAAISAGDRSDTDRLFSLVYDDFRRLADSHLGDETRSNTLQPTAVVHEAFIKLVDHRKIDWRGKSHFFAVGATAMRQILVDHARKSPHRNAVAVASVSFWMSNLPFRRVARPTYWPSTMRWRSWPKSMNVEPRSSRCDSSLE